MPNDLLVTTTDILGIEVPKEYSGASGINVDNVNNIISITGEVGKTYSGINPIVVNNDLNKISANTVGIGVEAPLYFSQDDEEGLVISLSGEYVTPSDLSGKLDTSSFNSWQEGQYTNDLTAINEKINEVSSSIPSLEGYATEQWVEDKGYLTEVSIPESATWIGTSNAVQSNSGTWNTVTYKLDTTAQVISSCETSSIDDKTFVTKLNGNEVAVEYAGSARIANIALKDYQGNSFVPFYAKTSALENKLDTTAFSDVSGSFLTAHQDLSNYYTKDETSGKEELADAFANIPVGDPEVNAYVTNNSASIDGTTSVVQSNSSTWADITAYQSNSGTYLTAINIPESATWNDVSTTVQSNSAQWVEGGGTTYTSPSGTILINEDTLEASTSAIGTTVKTVDVNRVNSYFSAIPGYPFDNYSAQTTNPMTYLTLRYGDWSDGLTVNDAMTAQVVEIPLTSGGYDLWLYNGQNVRISAVKSGVVELVKKDDLSDYATVTDRNALSASISSVSSDLYELSGKTITGSQLGTISFNGQNIEATTSAITQTSVTAEVTNGTNVDVTTLDGYPFDQYTFTWTGENTGYVQAIYGNWSHTEYITYNSTGASIPTSYNGTNLKYVGYHVGVLSAIKNGVVELQQKLTFGYDEQDRINSINNSALALGVALPNISADLARMMGVDETVLFETTARNGAGVCNLSESLKNFRQIKVLATRGYNGDSNTASNGGFAGPWSVWETDGISAEASDYKSVSPFIFEGYNWKNSVYSADSSFTTLTWYRGCQKNMASTAAGTTANSFTGCVGIKKVIGIGRRS